MECCNFPFSDTCHLCIFLAEQDFIKITFSLGTKMGQYKIKTDCISTASGAEPLPATLLIARSPSKFCHTWQCPKGFITRVCKTDSLLFLPPVDMLLVNPGHEKRK